jgi:hypothetical protein
VRMWACFQVGWALARVAIHGPERALEWGCGGGWYIWISARESGRDASLVAENDSLTVKRWDGEPSVTVWLKCTA